MTPLFFSRPPAPEGDLSGAPATPRRPLARRNRALSSARVLAASVLWLGACAEEIGTTVGVRGDCALVAVNSDYQSTSIALLNSDGTLCLEPLLHSGSARAGLVTALSGDVVLPGEPGGAIRVIDRYPNAVLTTLDADGRVLGQLSVATGFPSNPQDVLEVEGELWITRAASNPNPGREPYDGGGDILRVRDRGLVGRVPFEGTGDGVDPMPGALVRVGDRIAVGLSQLRRDFTAGGPGRIGFARLDGTPDGVLPLPAGFANCGGLERVGQTLVSVCTGVFADGDRVPTSGLVVLDPAARKVTAAYPAAGLGGALSFGVTALGVGEVVALLFGDLGSKAPDRIVRVDLATGRVTPTGISGGAFELGEPVLAPDGAHVRLLVPDGERANPRLRRFATLEAASELTPTNSSPAFGLPPRHLALRGLP